jgi:hypothetical protein
VFGKKDWKVAALTSDFKVIPKLNLYEILYNGALFNGKTGKLYTIL